MHLLLMDASASFTCMMNSAVTFICCNAVKIKCHDPGSQLQMLFGVMESVQQQGLPGIFSERCKAAWARTLVASTPIDSRSTIAPFTIYSNVEHLARLMKFVYNAFCD